MKRKSSGWKRERRKRKKEKSTYRKNLHIRAWFVGLVRKNSRYTARATNARRAARIFSKLALLISPSRSSSVCVNASKNKKSSLTRILKRKIYRSSQKKTTEYYRGATIDTAAAATFPPLDFAATFLSFSIQASSSTYNYYRVKV